MPPGEAATFANGRGIELYKAYQARLKTLNAADFGDLLIEMLRLFRDASAEVLRQYQERVPVRLVDEYPGHQRRAVSSGLRARSARARRTSAASATTTSRSMAGAAPRSTTSCASRRTFPAPR